MTLDEKKSAQIAFFNSILVGFGTGMYELFGEAALASLDEIGAGIVHDMEEEIGVNIEGKDSQSLLAELSNVMVSKLGICQQLDFSISDHQLSVHAEGCMAMAATKRVTDEGKPPYLCLPMVIAKSILKMRTGQKIQFTDINLDAEKKICNLNYRLI